MTSPFKEDLEVVQATLKRVSEALPGDDLAELEAATAALSDALEALSRNLPASEDERQIIIDTTRSMPTAAASSNVCLINGESGSLL